MVADKRIEARYSDSEPPSVFPGLQDAQRVGWVEAKRKPSFPLPNYSTRLQSSELFDIMEEMYGEERSFSPGERSPPVHPSGAKRRIL